MNKEVGRKGRKRIKDASGDTNIYEREREGGWENGIEKKKNEEMNKDNKWKNKTKKELIWKGDAVEN